ncbi:MAG: hypothetical protein H0V82_08555 [Candidatus Protochlamydia sp.]|nr:hypothetical protein [Candidatus Protochlamydia sp.]
MNFHALTSTDILPLFCWPNSEPSKRIEVLGTIRTAVNFGRVCLQMNQTISGEIFWQNLANRISNTTQFFFTDVIPQTESPWKDFIRQQFILNFDWVTNRPSFRKEELVSRGMWAFPIQCQSEIQYISFDDRHPLQLYSAKQNAISYPLVLPKTEKLEIQKPYWSIARNNNFIAVNGGGTAEVFIFSGSDYNYLSTFKFEGNVIQLEIHNDELYVVGNNKLVISKLSIVNGDQNEIFIPFEIKDPWNFQLCFGENYFLLKNGDDFIAASYKDIKEFVCTTENPFPWKRELSSNSKQFFSEGNHFIGASYHEDERTFSIIKVQIEDELISMQLIAEKITINTGQSNFNELFYSNGRLFITYYEKGCKKMAYFDVETNSIDLIDFELPENIGGMICSPRMFICTTALKIHYLCPIFSDLTGKQGHFILTLDFEKNNLVQNDQQIRNGILPDDGFLPEDCNLF